MDDDRAGQAGSVYGEEDADDEQDTKSEDGTLATAAASAAAAASGTAVMSAMVYKKGNCLRCLYHQFFGTIATPESYYQNSFYFIYI